MASAEEMRALSDVSYDASARYGSAWMHLLRASQDLDALVEDLSLSDNPVDRVERSLARSLLKDVVDARIRAVERQLASDALGKHRRQMAEMIEAEGGDQR